MSLGELTPQISSPCRRAVHTTVDEESSVTRDDGRANEARAEWQRLIDYQLIEWGRDPSRLEDEGIEPPTSETIRLATMLAEALKERGDPPPDTIVPDPNGGIVFERREKNRAEVFHVWDDDSVEYRRFEGTRLVERWML